MQKNPIMVNNTAHSFFLHMNEWVRLSVEEDLEMYLISPFPVSVSTDQIFC